jgi:hypothetical protein
MRTTRLKEARQTSRACLSANHTPTSPKSEVPFPGNKIRPARHNGIAAIPFRMAAERMGAGAITSSRYPGEQGSESCSGRLDRR